MTGKLFVLDGLDGCGKSTQFELLQNILSSNGYDNILPVSFPDYDSPSASLVKMYLSGTLSNTPDGVNAYAASSFYAVDRYANYKMHWEDIYNNGGIILASRYTTSNAIHQMSKLPESDWDNYLNWLEDYEYKKLMLPKPDCVMFLDMPIETAQKLLLKRYNGDDSKKDLHESDIKYIKKCRKSALYSAEKLKWKIINCCDDSGNVKSKDEICYELFETIQNNVLTL